VSVLKCILVQKVGFVKYKSGRLYGHKMKMKNTIRIHNSYCFFTATLVARKRLNVTLHILCLSCLNIILRSS